MRLLSLLAFLIAIAPAFDTAEARKRKWSTGARVVGTDLGLPAGTIVIVNNERRLYYVLGNGKAQRYRVAVGEREELWTGRTFVSGKKVNPEWNPVDGSRPIPGGSRRNPLGKRALYLDWSLLRIHGTRNPRSIGGAVSDGCVRMYNTDVIDLYERVHLGAPVIAVNRRRDIWRFRETQFTGKRPAWKGQLKVWRAKAKEERRRARRIARRRTRSARRSR